MMDSSLINVLLADDDKDDCLFFQDALEELPLSTVFTTVNDGEQLMQFLLANIEHLPNILFLDLNMPRKNGFECLLEIKKNEKLKELPVVIYSTSFDQEAVNILYNNGARYYIRKPAEFSKLKDVIHHALNLVAQTIPQPSKEFVLQP